MTDHTQVCTKELDEWLEKSKDLNLLDLASLLVTHKPLQKGENDVKH